jgi:hypothetical protein
MPADNSLTPHCCKSGLHVWIDAADADRCCNGWSRVTALSRVELEQIGAEGIVLRQLYRGWVRQPQPEIPRYEEEGW